MGSFRGKTEEQIEHSVCSEELFITTNKLDYESWNCAFAPDESCVAWSQGKGVVAIVPWDRCRGRIWDDGAEVTSPCSCQRRREVLIDCIHRVRVVAFGSRSPDAHQRAQRWVLMNSTFDLILATGHDNRRIRIWDVDKGKLCLELIDHQGVIRDLAFSPDGSLRLVSASSDSTLKVWDLHDDGNMIKTLSTNKKWVSSCSWSPNSKMLASVGSDVQVLIWNMDSYTLLRKMSQHSHDVVSCTFSPNGALLATASRDTYVFLWDPYLGVLIRKFGHLFPAPSPIFASGCNESWVRAVAFSPDGRHFASVADDGYVRFWDINYDEDPVKIAVVQDAQCCQYSPSGRTLIVGTPDCCITFWKASVKVETLRDLCRQSFRYAYPTSSLDNMVMPTSIKSFLKYEQ